MTPTEEIAQLKHRLAMVADDLGVLRTFIDKEDLVEFKKPTPMAESAWTHISNIEIACDLTDTESLNWKLFSDNSNDELPSFLSAENKKSANVAKALTLLKEMDVDGETMQYILEKVGMDEQMHRQLIMSKDLSKTLELARESAELTEQEIRRHLSREHELAK